MVSDVLLDVGIGEIRLALLENGELAEFYIERDEEESKVGNIYRGRIERVLPGMQSAFVDIGLSKNAFLYVKDIMPVRYDENGDILSPENGIPRIEELLSAGQELTVQIIKELSGNKGPRVTTRITIPGNFSVLMPGSTVVGVSRRIEDMEERKRLRELATENKPERAGIIIRTAADHVPEEILKDDINNLVEIWSEVVIHEARGAVPRCLYCEPDFVAHAVREYLQPDLNRFIINDRDTCDKVLKSLETTSPGLRMKVEYFSKDYDLFEYYHAESAINEALARKVRLKSGAYLVFDRTEAFTVIDVNSGKYIGRTNLEETAFKINMEAAEMVARQIRLRDISGIIIIDFIDMQGKEHRDQVVDSLREAVKYDRTQTVVIGMTNLGLVEITRKKIRQPLSRYLTVDCHCCRGTGWRISPVTIAKRLEKRIVSHLTDNPSLNMEIEVHPDIYKLITGTEALSIAKIEEAFSCKIEIKASEYMNYDDMNIKDFTS